MGKESLSLLTPCGLQTLLSAAFVSAGATVSKRTDQVVPPSVKIFHAQFLAPQNPTSAVTSYAGPQQMLLGSLWRITMDPCTSILSGVVPLFLPSQGQI